ncbi:MAG: hypothetical protein OCD02_23990 [Spirochaetaceae bacterium]
MGKNIISLMSKLKILSWTSLVGHILKFYVLFFFTLILSSCISIPNMPEFAASKMYSIYYSNKESEYFHDGKSLQTNVGEDSYIELQLAEQNRIKGLQTLQANFFLLNTSTKMIEFIPENIFIVTIIKGKSTAPENINMSQDTMVLTTDGPQITYENAEQYIITQATSRISEYAHQVSEMEASKDFSGVPSFTGLETFLFGRSIRESIIAGNQRISALNAVERSYEEEKQQISNQIDEFLLGRSSIKPGEGVNGGIGFDAFSSTIVTEIIVDDTWRQLWNESYNFSIPSKAKNGLPLMAQSLEKLDFMRQIIEGMRQYRNDLNPYIGESDKYPISPYFPANAGFSVVSEADTEKLIMGFTRIDTVESFVLFFIGNDSVRLPITSEIFHVMNFNNNLPELITPEPATLPIHY